MFLSDRDLRWAIETGRLTVEPKPSAIDPTSIDLHLDSVDEAKIWNLDAIYDATAGLGVGRGEVRIGKFDWRLFSKNLIPVPADHSGNATVYRRGDEIVIKPQGFLLWQTKEEVGTPEDRADLICFVEGKSTKARTGIIVHMTAPTIHSTWTGNITLEIANLGTFTFVLKEDDVIAQLTVCTISSPPMEKMKKGVTFQQKTVAGSAGPAAVKPRKNARPK